MIKQLEEKDTNAVMDIWLKTNISAHYFIPESYWIGNYGAVKGEYLPKAENFVYIDNEEVKAFISIMDGNLIGALFVSLEYQKMGIGKQLISYCKETYPLLTLAVYKDNTSAIKFYESCGFTIKEEQTEQGSGFQEYIMEWKR